jgi:hypothetical protein
LLTTLESYVRDPDSKVAAVRVHTVIDELQSAGNYIKAKKEKEKVSHL